MTDRDALLRAICENPDDDLPRLAFADWLDENDWPDRAAFVRAQVELARTPDWEPHAVFCRHRRPEWDHGWPWCDTLPAVPGNWTVDWHPQPFRRGFGWRVVVNALPVWNEFAPRLFETAPVGELDLKEGTLDQWREFARGDWLRRVRVLHFHGRPNEPLLALRESPNADAIEEIHFHRAGGAGMPFVLEELMESPLGRGLKGLHFHMGDQFQTELIDALGEGGSEARLERLSFVHMGLTDDHIERLVDLPFLEQLIGLSFEGNPFGWSGHLALAQCPHLGRLQSLVLTGPGMGRSAASWMLADSPHMLELKRVDLSDSHATPQSLARLLSSRVLGGVRAVGLRQALGANGTGRRLAESAAWPHLVELDLRLNPAFSDAGVRHLLAAPVPPDLTALLLDGHRLQPATRDALRAHFGDRVILEGEPGGGLG
jgi:uncharacterized protein (TIGR02996 family)